MINFNVYKLCMFLHMLEVEESRAMLAQPDDEFGGDEKAATPIMLGWGEEQAREAKLDATLERIENIRQHLKRRVSWSEWRKDVESLREALLGDLKQVYCYHYPTGKAEVYWSFMDQWGKTLAQFPSALEDAMSAIDCYGLDRNVASVFHSMRVAEMGLRALARERRVRIPRKPLEWANWQDIINGIRGKIKLIEHKRAGPARTAALDFYQGSLGEFEAFKDAYRNNVMHVRLSYDEHQALSILNHVREFMGRLAAKIGENNRKQIKWGRW